MSDDGCHDVVAPSGRSGERPQIVAQENCLARFRRYELTHGWNARINQRQFSLPAPIFPKHFDWPTLTFRDALTQRLGDLEVHYHAAMGETDDACWAWVPQRGYLFTGDHLDWDRDAGRLFASEDYCWYSWPEQIESMERLADYRFEWVLPGHGQRVNLPAAEMRSHMTRLVANMREGSLV